MKKTRKTLRGLFNLDHNIKIYIPSTVNVDQVSDNGDQVKRALTLFSGLFGGSTAYDALGAWVSQDKGLVTEAVKIVESYATKEQLHDGLAQVLEFAQTLKTEMNQEAISIEYDNKLYFI